MGGCPVCNGCLIELYTRTEGKTASYSFYDPSYNIYGFWCPKCVKLFAKRHKTWLEEMK